MEGLWFMIFVVPILGCAKAAKNSQVQLRIHSKTEHTITIKAYDAAGNAAETSIVFQIEK